MANMLEKLVLSISADERAAASWGRVQDSVVGVVKSIGNVIKQHEKLSEVFGIYGEAADQSFSNLTTTASKLSTRLQSITSNFTATNVMMETLGAGADVVNHAWNEMGVTAERWNKLAGNQLVMTTVKLYVAYKVLAFTIGTVVSAFYKTGQALADNIKIQQQVSESIARMTGDISGLTEEYQRLAQVRIYTTAARDLSSLGKLWQASGIAVNVLTAGIEALAVKFVTLGTKIPGVQRLIDGLTESINLASEAGLKAITTNPMEEAFDIKMFESAAEAINYVRENMHAWSEETRIGAGEIQGAWEGMSRTLGDVKLASQLLTAAMANIHSRGNVGGQETLRAFQKLADGAQLTTEEIRALGVGINTASNDMLRSSKIMELFTKRMIDSAHTMEAVKLGEELQKNFHLRISMLGQDVNKFVALEKQLTSDMIEDITSLSSASAKSYEDRIKYINLVNTALSAYAAQQLRVNALIGAQTKLQSATTGTGVIDKYTQQIADLQVRLQQAKAVFDAGNRESARELLAGVREGYAALYSGITEGGRDFLAMMQNAVMMTNKFARSMGDAIPTNDVQELTAIIETGNKRAVEAFRQRWELEKQILENTSKGTEEYARRAAAVTSVAQDFRNQLIAASNESVGVITAAKQSIIEIYDLEGQGIENNLRSRLDAFDTEIRYAQRMQQMYKSDASERFRFIQREIDARKAMISAASQSIAASAGNILTKGGGQFATEAAYEKHFGRIVKWIETNPGVRLPEQFQKIIERMGPQYQKAVESATQTSEARRFEQLRKVVDSAKANSGDTLSGFVKALENSGTNKTDIDIILNRQGEYFQSLGVKLLTGTKGKDDPYKGLQKAVDDLTDAQKLAQKNLENAQDAIKSFDEREALFLQNITTAIGQVTDAGVKFQDLAKTLGIVFNEITAEFGVRVNQFNGETSEFKEGVDSLSQLVDEAHQKFFGSETGIQAEGDETTIGRPGYAEATEEQIAAVGGEVNKVIEEMDRRIRSVTSSTAGDIRKEKAIAGIIAEYSALFSDARASAEKFGEILGVADTTTFRDAIAKAVAEAAKNQMQNRAYITPEHLGGRRPLSDSFETAEVTDKFIASSDTTEATKLAERGMEALRSLLFHQRDGMQADRGIDERKFALAFNYAGILTKGALEQKKYLNSQEAAMENRDIAESAAPAKPEVKVTEPPKTEPVKPVAPPPVVTANAPKTEIRVVDKSSAIPSDTSQRKLDGSATAVINGKVVNLLEQQNAAKDATPKAIAIVGGEIIDLLKQGNAQRKPQAEAAPSPQTDTAAQLGKHFDRVLAQTAAERQGRAPSTPQRELVVEKPSTVPTLASKPEKPTPVRAEFDTSAAYQDIRNIDRRLNAMAVEKANYSKVNQTGYYDKKLAELEQAMTSMVERRSGLLQGIRDAGGKTEAPKIEEPKTPAATPPQQPQAEKSETAPPASPVLNPEQLGTGIKLLSELAKVAGDIYEFMRTNAARNSGQSAPVIQMPQAGNPLEKLRDAFGARGRGTNGTRRI